MKIKKIRKLKRKKRYNANVNRKRQRDKLRRLPNIPCAEIKNAWEHTKSIRTNLKEMGLSYDPNKKTQLLNVKHEMLKAAERKITENDNSSDEDEMDATPSKNYVAEKLEAEAKAPKHRRLKLPKGQAQFLTYLLKKYGEDYKAMAKDKKNHYQLTGKQIQAKIKQFQGISEQYNEYLEDNNIQLES
ncbi:nucleolar protein 16 [Linepithema humile]|uniref:nucleolar protein 16 n=1 Tax=Linepithema humile TaxID=83485 RepID=UPI0006236839|nr:PREDICTED: nucleolar protein 16-like [Linepithema humile]